MKSIFLKIEKGLRTILKTLLIGAISIGPFALGDGLTIRIADDLNIDFNRKFTTFESAIRNILKGMEAKHGKVRS